MIKLSELDEVNLIEYMKLYEKCNSKQKNEIFFIVLKNHLMYLKKISLKKFGEKYSYLRQLLNNLDSENIIQEIELNLGVETGDFDCSNINKLLELIQECDKKYSDNFDKSMACNFILYKNGMCPLIFYSFGEWIDMSTINEQELRKIMEFSMMSLYKVVHLHMKEQKDERYGDKGSVGALYLSTSSEKKKIIKVPKTMASLKFLSQQEYDIYKRLQGTDFQEFMARDYSFEEASKTLSHEFIEGRDGEYYLFNHISLNNEQEDSLRKFYEVYSNRKCKSIILDIHPGNFVWSEERKQWIIIDLGAIPEIGSDYYDFDKFEEYYDFVWKKRESMMKKNPIRSMDFDIDLDFK